MAEKTVCVSQPQTKPIKVIKWKVREGNSISIGRILLLYDFDGAVKLEHRKLKSTQAGIVRKIVAQEGAVVNPGEALFELETCCHPTIMNDMCAECGADLRKDDATTIASVPMIHAIPDLKVSEELAQKLGRADSERLIKDRKLVLLVDLDQTLIHTTNDNIPPNIKDVYHFRLYGPNSPWYHTRLRPGTHKFLNNIFDYFELHICTFGARNYAHTIAMFLDFDQRFFSNRILSRDECFDPTSKKANLKALFPCGDDMVCIIDDREDVWSHATNLIHVKPYHFFQHTGDINAPPGLDKHESDDKAGVDLTKIKEKHKPEPEGEEKIQNGCAKENNVDCNDVNSELDAVDTKVDSTDSNNATNIDNSKEAVNGNSPNNKIDSDIAGNVPSLEVTVEEVAKPIETNEEKISQTNVDEMGTKESRDEEVEKTAKDNDDGKTPAAEQEKAVSPDQSNSEENLVEIDDSDDYLVYLEDVLKRIHQAFYEAFDKMESGEIPDLKSVIPSVRGHVLKGNKLVFSGLVPTHIKLEQSKAYQVARSLGAVVTQDLEDDTTHLVAVRPGTAKVNAGRRKKNLKIVTPDWLWCCAERWEHVDERIFPLNSKGSKNRHPPPHCSSPEHIPNYPEHDQPTMRKRTPSGRFMDTINPLMSFSSADIADMDKEVEDILDDESDSSDDEGSNKAIAAKVLKDKESSESSSNEESQTGEYPKGFKRKRLEEDNSLLDDVSNNSSDDSISTKFRRGEPENEGESQDSDEHPDEADDGEWNIMGAALERQLSN